MRRMIGTLLVAAAGAGAVPASARVYSDDFGKCLVEKTSDADKTLLMQWMFAAMSANPAVQSMATVTTAQRTDYNRRAAKMMDRLVTADCRKAAVAALKADGPTAIHSSFALLGQVAMQGIMRDGAVNQVLTQLGTSIDQSAWTGVMKEAGIDPAAQR